jgi:hypothetical protein
MVAILIREGTRKLKPGLFRRVWAPGFPALEAPAGWEKTLFSGLPVQRGSSVRKLDMRLFCPCFFEAGFCGICLTKPEPGEAWLLEMKFLNCEDFFFRLMYCTSIKSAII